MRTLPGCWIATIVVAAAAVAGTAAGQERDPSRVAEGEGTVAPPRAGEARPSRQVRPYVANVFRLAEDNTNYRRVLFTGERSQLVVMSVPPGESIGQERHPHVEQTLVIVRGSGEAVLDGRRTRVGEGDVIVVTPGTEHNLENTGETPLQVFTTYVPPNHIDGRIHATKRDAERDAADERFGREVE